MSTFEIGFLHKNGSVDFRDPNNKKPWYRGNLKIDGQEVPVVVFPSERNGKTYLTIKPDRPNPNQQASGAPRRNDSGGSYGNRQGPSRYQNAGGTADLDDSIPF